jgi:hypothetical protein
VSHRLHNLAVTAIEALRDRWGGLDRATEPSICSVSDIGSATV